ncbi:FecR family protein [Echinicola sp. 20G]|uniref:FecR family protein n=1 Tax=Echinicola sp. 20G TaxID=2781961 RepID=UPI001910DE63|nr:FecR domain-containing protein [Echinicola sp. 20G]
MDNKQKYILKYKDYELEDFLGDEYFISWVKNPNGNSNHFWERWITENVDKSETVMQAATVIRSMAYKNKPELSNKAYVEIFENVLKSEPIAEEKGYEKPSHPNSTWGTLFGFHKIAAAILLIFCAWIILDTYVVKEPVELAPLKWEVRENPAGIKSTIKMGDGTVVNLNSNSKLTFLEKFPDSLRLVKLEGEAFFDVQKDGRPFLVDLGKTQVEVMGTTFNVEKRQEGKLSVALVSGKVKVKDQLGNQVILNPMEMLKINENGEVSLTSFDTTEIIGWKDKILVFKNSNKTEIIQKISDWYGVEVLCDPKIKDNWAYSGEYHNESLENVLKGIKRTLNIDYNINGKKVELIQK